MVRVGPAIQLGRRGHNAQGPASICIRYLVKTAMHTTRRDPTTFDKPLKGVGSIRRLARLIRELIEEGFVEFKCLPGLQS